MKGLYYFAAFLFGVVVGSNFFPKFKEMEKIVTKTDSVTVTKVDTFRYDKPVPVFVRSTDTLVVHDTILIKEQKVYSDSTYTAWISGYQPALDSIEVYPKTVTNYITTEVTKTVTKIKKPKWVISVGGGIGYNGKVEPYVGLNAGYVIWSK